MVIPAEASVRGESVSSSSHPEEIDTGIELFLTADYGPQQEIHFKVSSGFFKTSGTQSAVLNRLNYGDG